MESQHCCSTRRVKDGRILTQDVLAIFYDLDKIVSTGEIREKGDLERRNLLLVYRHCFVQNVEIPTSSGRTNVT